MEKEKDPNKDPNNMGGPSFHPDLPDKKKAPENPGAISKNSDDGAILDEDQVPPL